MEAATDFAALRREAATADLSDLVTSHSVYPVAMSPVGNPMFVLHPYAVPGVRRGDPLALHRWLLHAVRTLESALETPYEVIFCHESASWLPGRLGWLQSVHAVFPRSVRKNVAAVYVLHSNMAFKSVLFMCRPFVSKKAWRKVFYVKDITELLAIVQCPLALPECVVLRDGGRSGGGAQPVVVGRAATRVFGVSLAELLQRDRLAGRMAPVPTFLRECAAFVETYGMARPGIYREGGSVSETERLKNAVNDGDVGYGVRPLMAAALTQAVSAGGISRKQAVAAEVTHSQVDCVASMFKAFIRELSPSVFPRESYAAAIGAFTDGGDEESAVARLRDVVDALPPDVVALLRYIVSHLCRVAMYADRNLMTSARASTPCWLHSVLDGVACDVAANLAIVFAPTVLRAPEDLAPIVVLQHMPRAISAMALLLDRRNDLFASAPGAAAPQAAVSVGFVPLSLPRESVGSAGSVRSRRSSVRLSESSQAELARGIAAADAVMSSDDGGTKDGGEECVAPADEEPGSDAGVTDASAGVGAAAGAGDDGAATATDGPEPDAVTAAAAVADEASADFDTTLDTGDDRAATAMSVEAAAATTAAAVADEAAAAEAVALADAAALQAAAAAEAAAEACASADAAAADAAAAVEALQVSLDAVPLPPDDDDGALGARDRSPGPEAPGHGEPTSGLAGDGAFVAAALLPDGWAQFETDDGIVYYGNDVTGESSWDVPIGADLAIATAGVDSDYIALDSAPELVEVPSPPTAVAAPVHVDVVADATSASGIGGAAPCQEVPATAACGLVETATADDSVADVVLELPGGVASDGAHFGAVAEVDSHVVDGDTPGTSAPSVHIGGHGNHHAADAVADGTLAREGDHRSAAAAGGGLTEEGVYRALPRLAAAKFGVTRVEILTSAGDVTARAAVAESESTPSLSCSAGDGAMAAGPTGTAPVKTWAKSGTRKSVTKAMLDERHAAECAAREAQSAQIARIRDAARQKVGGEVQAKLARDAETLARAEIAAARAKRAAEETRRVAEAAAERARAQADAARAAAAARAREDAAAKEAARVAKEAEMIARAKLKLERRKAAEASRAPLVAPRPLVAGAPAAAASSPAPAPAPSPAPSPAPTPPLGEPRAAPPTVGKTASAGAAPRGAPPRGRPAGPPPRGVPAAASGAAARAPPPPLPPPPPPPPSPPRDANDLSNFEGW